MSVTVDLRLGDCLEIMRDLPDGCVDAVVTDPPYGVGKAAWDNEAPLEWIPLAERVSPRMLVMPGNTALISVGARLSDYKDCLVLRNTNGMTRSPLGFGKWIPVLVAGNWSWVARPNLISFTVRTGEVEGHPCPKPLEAMVRLIEQWTEPRWTVLDPFMGSGTTGVACVQTGRNFIGIEINPEYFAIAERRIAEAQRHYQPQLALA